MARAGARLQTIVGAAAVGGTLDLASIFALLAPRGIGVERILQSVASGILGKSAFAGGDWAATIGFAAHYAIMLVFAAVYIFASRYWPSLWRNVIASGTVYGLLTFVLMNYIVVPLSAAARWPDWTALTLAHALSVHVVFVGWIIGWFARGERQ